MPIFVGERTTEGSACGAPRPTQNHAIIWVIAIYKICRVPAGLFKTSRAKNPKVKNLKNLR